MRKPAAYTLWIIFVTVAAFLASAQVARACSCMVNDTVDKDFVQVPNIAVFKLQAVEKYREGEKGYTHGRIRQSKLSVEKVYKGNLKVGQVLTFAQGTGADCVWAFDEESVGQEYLFYLDDKPTGGGESSGRMISSTTFGNPSPGQNVWIASTCSRSGNVIIRAGDLKYLENISKVRGRTRLSGILMQQIPAAVEDEQWKANFLSEHKITIEGNGKSIELKTDKSGFYEIYDLPSGKYKITPEKISGYKPSWFSKQDSIDIEIKAGGHAEHNFNFSIDNRISGRFFDANRKPLEDVCLRLLPARGKPSREFYEADCTDENGRFEIDEIPAGSYVLVVNDDGEISADEPFGTFYYPGALKREDAAVITIGAGEFRDDLIVIAPQIAEVVTVSGVLLYQDGKPVADESVKFYAEREASQPDENDDKSPDSTATTSKDGRFSIRILKGQKGKLFGSMITFVGEYEKCPKLDRLIRAKGGWVSDIDTPPILIEAAGDLTGIELKFPFPGCKKAKLE